MRVDLVVSAGFTEQAAKAFLARAGFEVRQISPRRRKPGPKPGHPVSEVGQGTTGRDLVRELLEVASVHQGREGLADVLVLLDDADCRFLSGDGFDQASFATWRDDLERRVRARVGRNDLLLVVLLASPEIEAWFVADWANGFGGEFRWIEVSLRRSLQSELPRGWAGLESYGGPQRVGGGCTSKLSDRIAELIKTDPAAGQLPPTHREYSKSVHGVEMLRRIDPDRVAAACPCGFRPGWLALTRAASPGP